MSVGSTSVIVPTFNEEENIPRLGKTLRSFSEQEEVRDIIVVDDCSQDQTFEKLKRELEGEDKVVIKELLENKGKAEAVRNGVKHSNEKYNLLMDADLRTDNPENISSAISFIEENDHAALTFPINMEEASGSIISKYIAAVQDLRLAEKRFVERYTSNGETSRVYSLNGAALCHRELLEVGLDQMKNSYQDEDTRLACKLQFDFEESIGYFDGLRFVSKAPEDLSELGRQILRWDKSSDKVGNDYKEDFIDEIQQFSRFGIGAGYKAGKKNLGRAVLGTTILSAMSGNYELALTSAALGYGASSIQNCVLAGFSTYEEDLDKNTNLLAAPLLPAQYAAEITLTDASNITELYRNLHEKVAKKYPSQNA